MMKLTAGRIVIAVFTGTGNTLVAANALAGALRRTGKAVDVIPMHRRSGAEALAAAGFGGGDALGLAVPAAYFSTYPAALRFIDSLPEGKGREAFLVGTMGGFAGGMQSSVGRGLVRKGYSLTGARFFRACGNCGGDIPAPEGLPAVHAKLRDGAEAFCAALLAGGARWGAGRWNIAAAACEWFVRKGKSPRAFRRLFPLAADAAKCTGCGLCARWCPDGAIVLRDGKAVIDQSPATPCGNCQRCAGYCPAHAVGVPGKAYRQHRSVPPGEMAAFLEKEIGTNV